MARNFNAAFASTSQKMNESKQILNIKTMTMRINNDVNKKMFVKKSTCDLINQITINCQNIMKIIKF